MDLNFLDSEPLCYGNVNNHFVMNDKINPSNKHMLLCTLIDPIYSLRSNVDTGFDIMDIIS